ncbi:uncharacterized protein CDV56_109330 [Aspergillus thermomutatus]|uniref:Uncharacterized protein n=1 Tax=Aspergillus thermomutatus TaxID=41047 RepID=A0A397HVA1_ASPTH|nr:uncharacterized protein CDV56_109330 [Aspergillus thermomutatus]RHZ67169.1 hypothetical protein CDV56_109330 [Aspergillus thermomutatus]
MVHIKHDAELMTSLLAADKIPAGIHFVAFKDTSSNPALFSLSDDGKLNLVMDDDGDPTLMNFRDILPYEGSVLAFDVQQHSDLTLNIGLVTQGWAGKERSIWWKSDFTRTVAGREFPLIFLALEREDRITKEEQLGLVDITVTDGKPILRLNTSWRLATNGRHIPLLKEGEGGRLSGILTVPSALENDDSNSGSILVRTLISVNTAGDLFLLQEASDTKIWEVHPFYVGCRSANIEMDGYALRIQAIPDVKTNTQKDMDVEVVAGCQLHVVSSGYTRAVVNGRATNLTSHGCWLRTDTRGTLLIMMGTDDVACHSIYVDGYLPPNARDEEDRYQPIQSSLMDPSTKVVKKLRQIQSGKDLMTAKTQSGQNLVDKGALSESDADVIARNIARLCAHLNTHIDYQSKLLKAGNLKQFFFSDLADSAWGFFHWIQEKVEEVTDWVIDTAKSLWTLTVKLAGEVYNFVLSTAETVLKAIGWLLAKSGVVVNKLIDFAGFIFNWTDILHTSDSISTLISTSLSYGQEKLKSVNDSIKSWVDDTKKLVQSSRGDLESRRKELSKVESVEGEDIILEAQQLIQYSVSFNWVGDQMNHGDFLGLQLDTDELMEGMNRSRPPVEGYLGRNLQGNRSDESLAEQLGSEIPHVFGSADERNEAAFHVANVACEAALSSIENLATVVFKAAELLLDVVRMFGETPIEIPLFTPLWHTIAGKDRPFTLFNCFSLLMAIPTTIVYKLLYQRAPPQLKGRVTKATLAGYFNGTKPTDLSLHKDLRSFSGAMAIGAGYVGLAFTTISLAWSLAEIGATVAQLIEVLSTVPPWEGFDNETALNLAWVVWGVDLAWLIGCTAVRVYYVWTTTGTHVADFMKHPILGYYDLGRASVKLYINFPIIWFEFFTGDFHVLKLLRAYLRLYDGGVGVIGALAYLIAGVAAKTKKDVALMATGVEVAAELIKWAVKYGDKWAENEIKESQPPKTQG